MKKILLVKFKFLEVYNRQKDQFLDSIGRDKPMDVRSMQLNNMGKVDQMKSLQEVILHLAVQVKEKIKAITSILDANLKSPQYPEGLL